MVTDIMSNTDIYVTLSHSKCAKWRYIGTGSDTCMHTQYSNGALIC